MGVLTVSKVLMNTDSIRTEALSNGIVQIVLARPAVKNAFHEQMMSDITTSLEELSKISNPSDLRLLVIRGEGSIFSSGADLAFMKSQVSSTQADNLASSRTLAKMYKALASFPAPIMAAVQGAAIAGATGLIACCDYVIATEDAYFSLPEVRLGIVAATIAPYLVRKLGVGHASSLMMSGKRISASEAKHIGLIHEIAPIATEKGLEEALNDRAIEFLKCSPEALRHSKALLFFLAPLPSDATIEYTAEHLASVRMSNDAREGLAAFFEKRKPSWYPGLPIKSQ